MHNLGDLWGVTLRQQGVLACTRGVLMRTIASSVQKFGEAAVCRASYPPRLLDWHAGHTTTSGCKAVHATIEVRDIEPVFGHEPNDLVVLPVGTFPWPLYEDSRADAQSVLGDDLEGRPESFEQLPMELDLGDGGRTSLEVDVLPCGTPGAWSRKPEGIRGTTQVQHAFPHARRRGEVVILGDRNDLTASGELRLLL